MKKLFYILALIAVFAACKKKTVSETHVLNGIDYYPTTLGNYVIYEVDSIVYDEFTSDTTHYKYLIKEKLEEEFTDPENKTALKIARYIKKFNASKPYDSIAWTIKDIWQANVNKTNVEVVEENVRFTKLIFPVKEGSTWDGNAKNSIGQWDYTYSYIDKSENINSIPLQKTLLVTQKNFRTLISWQYYVEKYTVGVGLVYREIIDIKHPVTSTITPVNNIPQKTGLIYKSQVISYGHE
ncbi:MAG: hypothetical protein J0L69_08320 [Bacteroidetes bacterium]|nr:hypothetical protein [Bacteroidota bacterium]